MQRRHNLRHMGCYFLILLLTLTDTYGFYINSDDGAKNQFALKFNSTTHRKLTPAHLRKDSNDFTSDYQLLKNEKECLICKSAAALIQETTESNPDIIAKAVRDICIKAHIEEADICEGVVTIFQAEVLTVLDKLVLSPDEICGLLLGPPCATAYNPFQMWNITIPPPNRHNQHYPERDQSTKRPNESTTLRVLQLSDIHLDELYTVGANVDCDRPMCCRKTSGPVKRPAGYWGSVGHCDLPTWTLENLFLQLSQKEKFDYILWTGDLPSHADWNQTRSHQIQLLEYLTNLFLKYFPDTPVYSAIGNHESVPVNGFPPPYIKGNLSISWLYDELVKSWSHWLPNSTNTNISRGGFYSVLLKPGFRLVSLNMNYCNNQNWWMLLNTTDPVGELSWLVSLLQKSESDGEKVHIIGHIPPGISCLKAWSWNYYKIVDRFSSVIAAQFFGHTHTDFVEIFYDVETLKQPLDVAYIAPSVTTYHDLPPGYRVYTIDGFYANSSWEVLDHETYVLNLTEFKGKSQPIWKKEYTVKEAYNLNGLSAMDWHEFSEELLKNQTMLDLFHSHFYKNNPPVPSCDADCRQNLVCMLHSGRSHDEAICKDLSIEWNQHLLWMEANTYCGSSYSLPSLPWKIL